jgi:hypothetical protein
MAVALVQLGQRNEAKQALEFNPSYAAASKLLGELGR